MRHRYCLRSENSWCSYWNKDKGYRTKLNLPEAVKVELTDLLDELRDGKLLSKCLHRKTQNVNESLNQLIRCPKSTFITKITLEIGVYSAILHFNDGACGISKVMEKI